MWTEKQIKWFTWFCSIKMLDYTDKRIAQQQIYAQRVTIVLYSGVYRSVVKYGFCQGGSGSVRSNHQTVSGASKKIVLPSIFDTSLSLSSFIVWSLQHCWMKECDTSGGQKILWPLLHIFRGSGPHDLHPWFSIYKYGHCHKIKLTHRSSTDLLKYTYSHR